MPQLFWNPLAINLFIELLMVSLLTGYFAVRLAHALRKQTNVKTAFFLLLTFASASCGNFLQFLSYALHPDYVDFALPFASVFGALAMSGFLLLALYFQRQTAINGWVEACILACLFVLVGIEGFVAIQRLIFLKQGMVEYRDAWLDIPFALGFFAVHGILLWRLVNTLAQERGISKRQSIWPAVRSLLIPTTRLGTHAAALRAFFYMTMLPAAAGVVLTARSFGLLDWDLTELLSCWLILLTYASFALVYINHTPEHSSFQFKLVGITLAVVLSILAGISWMIGSAYIDAYPGKYRLSAHTTIRFEPEQNGAYSFRQTSYHFAQDIGEKQAPQGSLPLPFEFPYYGKTYKQIFPRLAGMVGLHDVPLWRDIQHKFGPQPALFPLVTELSEQSGDAAAHSGLFYRASPDVAVITWNRLVSGFQPDAHYTFQLRLYPGGAIEMAYADLPDAYLPDLYYPNAVPMMMGIVPDFAGREVAAVRFASGLPFTAAPGQGLMEYHRLDFRAYLDRIYQPTALFIFFATLVILFIFPRFFQVSLNRPLQAMLHGVREIQAGNLATSITVSYHDEIGFLAASFNKMAAVQRDLVETLEAKVAVRSAEAAEYAARNARLEERNHLTRELHDTVSQTLFSANLIVDSLPDMWRENPALQQIRQLNKSALSEMRQLLLELRPEKLSQCSFGELLQKLVKEFEEQNAIACELEIASDAVLPPEVQLAFFRIAQEALHNIMKHAQANSILIHFDGLEGQGMLSVSDDGQGFAQEEVAPDRFGLQSMRERMAQLGGVLEITSALGEGTRLTAIWFKNHQANE